MSTEGRLYMIFQKRHGRDESLANRPKGDRSWCDEAYYNLISIQDLLRRGTGLTREDRRPNRSQLGAALRKRRPSEERCVFAPDSSLHPW